ncbi:ATP-binding protein [Streptomyces sp. SKN60]|uniref:ATP-binding protein n=1 Tax=Streptomyces TaxID=1883 RepID=UPI0022472619|nr:ATP-binding protein [Streptomyces sp. SKN60]MCX2183581.1 ATP-binding protein [Streptomyces sp. SKN60]
MSLPLTRRIARAALIVAAGAAPVVAAAGTASAAEPSLAPAGALTGLTSLDKAGAEGALGTATETATGVANKVPAAQKVTGATGQATDTVGQTTGAVTEKAEAPTGGALGGLPTGQLMGGLPIGG